MSSFQDQTFTEITTQSTPNRLNQLSTSSSSQTQDSEARDHEKVAGRSHKGSSIELISLMSPDLLPDVLSTTYTSRRHAHLPTPQSPHDIGQYIVGVPSTPESPVPHGSHVAYTSLAPIFHGQVPESQRSVDEPPIRSPSKSQQILTPESSPFVPRTTPSHHDIPVKPRFSTLPPSTDPTPRTTASTVKLESHNSNIPLAPAHNISCSSSSSPDSPSRSSLSSPFTTNLSIVDRTKSKTPVPYECIRNFDSRPVQIDDVFSSATSSRQHLKVSHSISTPPTSPLPVATAGGEIDRIRSMMMQDKIAHLREAESRRPEYLRRAKRTLAEAETSTAVEDERKERDRALAVGITESPNKGRRLKLFQETSEESFEESLMAGGYGRYRMADWVRQPQPLMTPGPAGPSTIVSVLESEAVPTEKESKKRKRLAAFRGEPAATKGPTTKLVPVHLEGSGRVVLDIDNSEQHVAAAPEPASLKKRGGNRRKKKGAEPTAKEKKALAWAAAAAEELIDRPNWPDSEFPWRLRTEEREALAKVEDEERMWWIEKFLDRDTDEEDEGEEGVSGEEDEGLSTTKWNLAYEDNDDRPRPSRRGRGKMVPLPANPNRIGNESRKTAFFQIDPADAKMALLSKKSVRALSYRQQKRLRETATDGDDEVVCICNSRDDGRPLVQCDGCRTWYHLQCIGIKNIADLGKEEDPWFCHSCAAETGTPSSAEVDEGTLSSEPTFVPTDDEPRVSRSFDAPFFQVPPSQYSPGTAWTASRTPQTPTRGSGGSGDFGSGFSSTSSYLDSPRHGPSTPHHPSKPVKVYTKYSHTSPGLYDGYSYNYDEPPFDPTSTPSRGIRFGGSFATPKNNLWSSRANGLFQTPSRPGRGLQSSRPFGVTGSFSSNLEDHGNSGGGLGFSPFRNIPSYDDSPIRRSKEEYKSRRVVEALTESSLMGLLPHASLQESPVMRSKGERERLDVGTEDIGLPSDGTS